MTREKAMAKTHSRRPNRNRIPIPCSCFRAAILEDCAQYRDRYTTNSDFLSREPWPTGLLNSIDRGSCSRGLWCRLHRLKRIVHLPCVTSCCLASHERPRLSIRFVRTKGPDLSVKNWKRRSSVAVQKPAQVRHLRQGKSVLVQVVQAVVPTQEYPTALRCRRQVRRYRGCRTVHALDEERVHTPDPRPVRARGHAT
jgi:hypothetical protein